MKTDRFLTPEQDMARYGFSKKSKFPMLTLRTHGLLDYGAVIAFSLAPYVFRFSQINQARIVFHSVALVLLVYSLSTEYFQSIFKFFPFAIHRVLDITVGIFIATAPSSFGYKPQLSDFQSAVHLILGLGWVYLAFTTRTMGPSELVEGLETDKAA